MRQFAVLALGMFVLTAGYLPSEALSETLSPASAASPTLSREEQGLGTPAAFLAAIYKHYESSDTLFTTLNENSPNYYEPGMLALMAEDHRLNEGEVGAIEADPICRCQDFTSLSADIRMLQETATTARLEVVIKDTGVSYTNSQTLIYDLVKIEGRWRIRDILGSGQSSLRQDFILSNARYSKPAA